MGCLCKFIYNICRYITNFTTSSSKLLPKNATNSLLRNIDIEINIKQQHAYGNMTNFDFIVKDNITVNGNATIKGNSLMLGAVRTYISSNISLTTESVIVDSNDKAVMCSAKYLMQVSSGNQNQISEILVVHDGTNSKLTEYGILSTASEPLARFDTDILGNNVRVVAAMTSATGSLWFSRTNIEIPQ